MNITKPHTDKIFIGALFCLAAHFFFFIMGWSAKYLSQTHHVAEIAFYRNLIVLLPLLIFILIPKNRHYSKTTQPRWVAFRAIIGGISLVVTYSALSMLPMSYATVLFFTSTILTPIFAHFFLREHVGPHRWAAVAFGMVGVYIIAQPSGEFSTLGMGLALLAALLHASMFVTLRQLKSQSPLTVTFYFMIGGTLIPGLAMPWIAQAIRMEEIWIFLVVAASGGMAQIFLANAYKFAPASVITPFAYSALIWSLAADFFYWKYELNLLPVLGGTALIMTAQGYILYREYKNKKRLTN
jgi:drug/metabolite transporter (DMT)-like permease